MVAVEGSTVTIAFLRGAGQRVQADDSAAVRNAATICCSFFTNRSVGVGTEIAIT